MRNVDERVAWRADSRDRADLYGYSNFGAYYSYFQLGGSAAATTAAIIAGALFDRFGSYAAYMWGIAALNGLMAVLLLVVPVTKFKR